MAVQGSRLVPMNRAQNAVAVSPAWRTSRVVGGPGGGPLGSGHGLGRHMPYTRVGIAGAGCSYFRPRLGTCVGFGFGYHPVCRPYWPAYYPTYYPPIASFGIGFGYSGYSTVYPEPLYVDSGATYVPPSSGYYSTPDDYTSGGFGEEAPLAGVGPSQPQGDGYARQPGPTQQDDQKRPTGLSGDEMNRLMKEGVEAFAAGQYEDAARSFLRVSMADPQNIDAMLAYAVSRFATGDYPVAAIAIRRGVRAFPTVVNSSFDVRDRYNTPTDFDLHLQVLEEFVRERPDDVDGWVVLGFIRHFTAQRELTTRTFEMVKKLSQSDADVADIFLKAQPVSRSQPSPAPAPSSAPPSGQGTQGAIDPWDDGASEPVQASAESFSIEEDASASSPLMPSLEPSYELPSP